MDCKDLKISQMPKACHLHGGDLIPIVQHGQNKVINVQDLVDLFKRILPPPPHPHHHDCFPPHHHDDCFPPHHHDCHDEWCEPKYCGDDWEFNLIHRAREDAAIAKASVGSVEGEIHVAQRTADTALDASQKALTGVKVLKGQIDKIAHIIRSQQYLEAEVRNNKRKIKTLNTIVLALIEKIKELDPSDTSTFGDDWLSMLQAQSFEDIDFNHYHPHHHHHHHHQQGDDVNSEWVDGNVTDPDESEMTSDWVDDLNG